MDQERLPETFLGADSTLAQRWQALRLNVQTWYERYARAAGHGEIGRAGDLLWTYSQLTIPSEQALADGQQIDHILDWYRQQRPLHGAICWYLHPTPPVSLGARLFARGVSPNWQPHWMWCELGDLPSNRPPAATFEIQVVGEAGSTDETDPVLMTLNSLYPGQIYHLRAFQGKRGVGGCLLNVTSGEYGVGGLFDMWVKPKARKQGIGTALAQAACELARQLGCSHVVLNATEMGEPVYRRVGFRSLGYGFSWYLRDDVLTQPAPTNNQVAFLEALGLGDVRSLAALDNHFTAEKLQEPTLNGLTPLEITVHCQQPASADWLVEHGVIPDILSAWDLGWQERVPALLAEHPELVKRRGGRWSATPLHTAIERGDLALAQLLLTVPNDLESKDEVFESTPLEWARHFQRTEMITMIQQALTRDASS